MKLDVTKGDRYNKWTIIEEAKRGVRNTRYFKCCCECGIIKNVSLGHLRASRSKSCGCMGGRDDARIASITKHSMARTPTYWTWISMRQRCMNKNHTAYHGYGGRGITVCERWKDSFENFYADMGLRPDGKTLDRIDVNGNYEPSNCKWSTRSEQSRNTRRTVFFEGKKVTDIGDELGMNYTLLYDKLGKYSMESIKLIKEYGPLAVVKKDIFGNTLDIYKSAHDAHKKTGVLPSSISKCCRKEKFAITAGGFYWDFLLPEKIVEDTRPILKHGRRKLNK